MGAAVVRHTYRTDASFYAASLSYYALTALMPVLLLAFVLAAALGEIALAQQAVLRLGDVLTPRGRAFVLGALRDVVDRPGIVVFAAAVLVGSAIQLFRTLNRAFDLVYESGRTSSAVHLREGAFVVGVGLLGMTAVLTAAAAMSLYAGEEVRLLGTPLAVFLATGVALFPIFHTMPEPDVTAAEALPGAVFAALTWTVVGAVLGLYATHSDGSALYGLLGGLLLVITWLYAAHLAILLGASLNAVLAGRVSSDPAPDDPA